MKDWKKTKEWKKLVEINTDPYSKCVIDVAREVMKKLDTLPDNFEFKDGYYPELDTVHGLITEADKIVNNGESELTGAMASFVVNIVRKLHPIGEAFYINYK